MIALTLPLLLFVSLGGCVEVVLFCTFVFTISEALEEYCNSTALMVSLLYMSGFYTSNWHFQKLPKSYNIILCILFHLR